MTVPRSGLVLVVALALTAGCAGLLGGGETGPETRTVTPAPVPTTVTSPAPGVPAPEASGRGDVDGKGLPAADRRVRSNSAYRFERNATIAGPDGSIRFDRARRVDADGHVSETLRASATGEMTAVFDSARLWSNGTEAWSRMAFADGRVVFTRSITDDLGPFGLGLDLPETILAATELEVRGRTAGRLVLASDGRFGVGESLVPVATGEARNATARLTVSERGLVRSVRMDYETRTGNGAVAVSIRQRVTAVNGTTVTRPAWVDTARRNGSRLGV